MKNRLIVKAYGKQLDGLRGAASQIARDRKTDWSCEAVDKGAQFSFEEPTSKAAFASLCENLGLTCIDA